MAGFLYCYLPSTENRELVQGLTGTSVSQADAMSSPFGQSAVICARAGTMDPGRVGYVPDKQRWRKWPNEDIWVGAWLDQLPREQDLRRDSVLGGYLVEMRGEKWICPTGRGLSEVDGQLRFESRVDCSLDIDESGKWIAGMPIDDDESIYMLACRIWDWYQQNAFRMSGQVGNGDPVRTTMDIDLDEETNICVACLARNYLVGVAEVAILQLLTKETKGKILAALIDLNTFLDFVEKKTDIASLSTVDGSEAGSTAIVRP